MIVITIIGLLAAIAIPSYNTYVAKSKILEATTLLASFKAQVTEAYGTSSAYPSTLNLGSTSIPRTAAIIPYSGNVVTGILYYPSASSCGSFLMDIVLASSVGGGDVMLMGMTDTSGVVVFYCGLWDTTGTRGNSLQYLPATCNATNLHVIAGC